MPVTRPQPGSFGRFASVNESIGDFGVSPESALATSDGVFKRPLANDVEGAGPAGVGDEVNHDVDHEANAVTEAGLIHLVRWGLEGPVDEQGAAEDVLTRDKAPETAVGALGAVVPHGEDHAGRDDEVVALDVVGKVKGPDSEMAGARLFLDPGEIGWEIVAVGNNGVVGISVVIVGLDGLGFVLGDAVEVDDAVAEMDAVPREADGTLDQDEVGLLGIGLEEDDDVATVDVTVVDERSPLGGRSEGGAIDEDVVADEQGLLHGAGGDLEVLEDEGLGEDDQH